MSGISSVAFCKWHCQRVQCQALLPQQMKSSLTAPLTCQHGLAVGKHGTELFINRTLLILCLLWSNLQCVLGLFCLNTAGSLWAVSWRAPELQEAARLRRNLALLYSCALGRMSDTSVEALAAFPSLLEVCLLQHTAQDPSWSWAGRERSQQAWHKVVWSTYRHGCAGCSACKRWIWSLLLTWG